MELLGDHCSIVFLCQVLVLYLLVAELEHVYLTVPRVILNVAVSHVTLAMIGPTISVIYLTTMLLR